MNSIVIFFSSPHKNGFTAQLVNSYVDGCAADKIAVYDLYETNPKPCTDCGACKRVEGCAFSDLDGMMSAFEQADEVVFAFPVYNSSVPAPMKALLDRFQRYYNARFSLGKKPAVAKRRKATVLVTCGREWKDAESVVMLQLTRGFSILNLESPMVKFIENTDKN